MISNIDDEVSRSILEKILLEDDGAAAIGHLTAGRPITYRDPHIPEQIIRQWPDGRRERIDVDNNGRVTVLGDVEAASLSPPTLLLADKF